MQFIDEFNKKITKKKYLRKNSYNNKTFFIDYIVH